MRVTKVATDYHKQQGTYSALCELDYRLKNAILNSDQYPKYDSSLIRSLKDALLKGLTIEDAIHAVQTDITVGVITWTLAMPRESSKRKQSSKDGVFDPQGHAFWTRIGRKRKW